MVASIKIGARIRGNNLISFPRFSIPSLYQVSEQPQLQRWSIRVLSSHAGAWERGEPLTTHVNLAKVLKLATDYRTELTEADVPE
jgi:hypothetical protein